MTLQDRFWGRGKSAGFRLLFRRHFLNYEVTGKSGSPEFIWIYRSTSYEKL